KQAPIMRSGKSPRPRDSRRRSGNRLIGVNEPTPLACPQGHFARGSGGPSLPIVLDRIARKTEVLRIDRPKISSEMSVRFLAGIFHLEFSSLRGWPGLFQFLGRRNDFWIMALEAGLFPFPNEAVHDEFLENSGIDQRALSGCRRSDPCRLRQVQALGDHSTNIASRGARARLAGPGPSYHADRGPLPRRHRP